ncbi:MAG: aminotransferase class I/II-fold pyridoxal phosphate-dependent enzyme [Clostridiales Family XIII bacterium]|jgi:histidinol-phosphate aminotransferase|nr:aminotransferase class I/II-fold pyridoxal phosphate-dependent enzyme [Clostridiales Family XIII bacterium]
MSIESSSCSWQEGLYDGEVYVSGEQPEIMGLIKLNSNENPFPPAPEVLQAIVEFDARALRFYPKGDGSPLRKTLADIYGFNDSNIFIGNGSDDVLALAFKACFGKNKPILFPDISYSFYPIWAKFFGIDFETVPLDESFRIVPEDYAKENGGVVIANPNAPTSIGEGREFIEEILKNNEDSVVIIDEAYAAFGGFSAGELVHEYDNLLVVRSFSKSRSLAGLRLGYAIGSDLLIKTLISVKDSFNSYPVDSITIAAGMAAIESEDYFRMSIAKIREVREKTAEQLKGLGFKVLPSSTNFIFITHERVEAKVLFNYLRMKNILVRYFDKPRIDNYLRITIGTSDEMETLLEETANFFQS